MEESPLHGSTHREHIGSSGLRGPVFPLLGLRHGAEPPVTGLDLSPAVDGHRVFRVDVGGYIELDEVPSSIFLDHFFSDKRSVQPVAEDFHPVPHPPEESNVLDVALWARGPYHVGDGDASESGEEADHPTGSRVLVRLLRRDPEAAVVTDVEAVTRFQLDLFAEGEPRALADDVQVSSTEPVVGSWLKADAVHVPVPGDDLPHPAKASLGCVALDSDDDVPTHNDSRNSPSCPTSTDASQRRKSFLFPRS